MMTVLLTDLVKMLVIMLLGIRYLARLIDVPRAWLAPVLLLICVLGTYAVNNSLFDVWVMFGFGLFALWFRWVGIPLAPFVIGLILAPIAEESFRHAVIGSQGDYLTFFRHPISAILIVVALLVGLLPWFRRTAVVPGATAS